MPEQHLLVHGPGSGRTLQRTMSRFPQGRSEGSGPAVPVRTLGRDTAGRWIHAVDTRWLGDVYVRCLAWILEALGETGRVALEPAFMRGAVDGPAPGGHAAPARRLVLYYCYAGVHTSVLAACLHLGLLPAGDARPADILRLPAFDRFRRRRFGEPYLMGADTDGCAVACVGLGFFRHRAAAALAATLNALGLGTRVHLVPTLEHAGPLLRLGGWCSQRLGLVGVGRHLVVHDLIRRWPAFVAAVEAARREASVDGPAGGGR